jgi:sterol desaturase/sphingolipid hydroxylase (fatty acid hydroxylase superfamily)
MAWYWWILIGILGLNALVIALVALFLVLDSVWSKRGADREHGADKPETADRGRLSP